MRIPDARRQRLRTAGSWVLDGLLAVVAAGAGLAEVEALAAEVARAGVRVEVRIEGTPCELPAGLDLSAYRIVQEALTNYCLALLGGRLVVRRDLT
jgi:signal transduction histidine kinase